MTYRCGVGMRSEAIGLTPGPPQVTCDGCGLVKVAVTATGYMAAWLRKGTTPPGWRKVMHEDMTSEDFCKKCRVP